MNYILIMSVLNTRDDRLDWNGNDTGVFSDRFKGYTRTRLFDRRRNNKQKKKNYSVAYIVHVI